MWNIMDWTGAGNMVLDRGMIVTLVALPMMSMVFMMIMILTNTMIMVCTGTCLELWS